MEKIRILLADDHKIFRDGMKSLLQKEKDLQIVDEAQNGLDVIEKLNNMDIDVVLMDIDMGVSNGLETTENIKKQFPDVKVLILSMLELHEYIIKALEAGATGYIHKNAGIDEVLSAIRSVAKGDSYFSKEVSSKILDYINKPKASTKRKDIPLTAREIEVLKLIAEEYSNPEIANKLYISIRTVDTHRRNLLEKLSAKNTAGLVKYAIKEGLLE